jgi:integrase
MAGVVRKKLACGLYRGWYYDSRGARIFFKGFDSITETQEVADAKEADARRVKLEYAPAPTTADKSKTMPIQEAVDAYLGWGNAHGGRRGFPWGKTHARNRKNLLNWWKEKLSLSTLADLREIRMAVEVALQGLKKAEKSGKTLQNYLDAIHSFCQWLTDNKKLSVNPLEGVAGFDTTPETERRPATREELCALLEKCAPHRRLLYEVAFCSGLRANELRNLTYAHLMPSGIKLDAAWTKNRRPGFQPLPADLVARLKEAKGEAARIYRELPNAWKRKAKDLPAEPLLYVPTHTARDLELDLTAAGSNKWIDGAKLDFHALRVAYCTFVIESGANIKEAQTLMRHSTADQTMKAYAKVRPGSLAVLTEAVRTGIMAAPKQEAAEALKTGTDGRQVEKSGSARAHSVHAKTVGIVTPCQSSAYKNDSAGSIPAASTKSLPKQGVNSGDTQAVQSLNSPMRNDGEANDASVNCCTLPVCNKNTDFDAKRARSVHENQAPTTTPTTLTRGELRAAVERCADLDARTRRAVLALLAEED